MEPGDEIMAGRGFDIEADIPSGVLLNIPPFLNGQPQLSAEDEAKTRKIASVRVHVDRACNSQDKKLQNLAPSYSIDIG